jgi:hypothetical protein
MHGLYNFNGCNGTVTALCEGGEVPDTPDTPNTPTEGITVKAKVPAHWTNTISAWVWGEGMSDHWASVAKDGEWYVVTENSSKYNIIFVNGTTWDGNANQTEDMTFTANTCIQLTQSGNEKAKYEVIDCDLTAVEYLEVNELQSRKVLFNGALYLIMPNGQVYDVCGNQIR